MDSLVEYMLKQRKEWKKANEPRYISRVFTTTHSNEPIVLGFYPVSLSGSAPTLRGENKETAVTCVLIPDQAVATSTDSKINKDASPDPVSTSEKVKKKKKKKTLALAESPPTSIAAAEEEKKEACIEPTQEPPLTTDPEAPVMTADSNAEPISNPVVEETVAPRTEQAGVEDHGCLVFDEEGVSLEEFPTLVIKETPVEASTQPESTTETNGAAAIRDDVGNETSNPQPPLPAPQQEEEVAAADGESTMGPSDTGSASSSLPAPLPPTSDEKQEGKSADESHGRPSPRETSRYSRSRSPSAGRPPSIFDPPPVVSAPDISRVMWERKYSQEFNPQCVPLLIKPLVCDALGKQSVLEYAIKHGCLRTEENRPLIQLVLDCIGWCAVISALAYFDRITRRDGWAVDADILFRTRLVIECLVGHTKKEEATRLFFDSKRPPHKATNYNSLWKQLGGIRELVTPWIGKRLAKEIEEDDDIRTCVKACCAGMERVACEVIVASRESSSSSSSGFRRDSKPTHSRRK